MTLPRGKRCDFAANQCENGTFSARAGHNPPLQIGFIDTLNRCRWYRLFFCIEKAVLPFGKTAEGGEKIHIVGQNFYQSKL